MCNNCNKDDFAIGIFLGAVIGAGAALLLAPESGEKTRAKLKKASEKYVREGKEKFDELTADVSEKAAEYSQKVQDEVEDAVEDTKEMIEEKMKKLKKQKFTGIE